MEDGDPGSRHADGRATGDRATSLLFGASIIASGSIIDPGWIAVRDGRIIDLGAGIPPGSLTEASARVYDLTGRTVAPGFVDLHVHGGGGSSFSDVEPEGARRAARFHLAHGTTTLLASLVSARPGELERTVAALAGVVRDERRPDGSAGLIAGIHLEGPFLSAAACGAHDPSVLIDPDPNTLAALIEAGEGTVSMVTIAPERDGGIEAIRALRRAGVIAAIGHTAATHERAREAIDAGATVATHLFNAMSGIHHRAPGTAGAVLDDRRMVCELILDGAHLHPAVARMAIAAAGADRVALITDSISCAGMGDGPAHLGALAVEVVDGIARVVPPDGDAATAGALAGSTLTADRALRNAIDIGIDPVEASHMASTVPARVLGLDSALGSIEVGHRADLVVLDEDMEVIEVFWDGSPVRGTS